MSGLCYCYQMIVGLMMMTHAGSFLPLSLSLSLSLSNLNRQLGTPAPTHPITRNSPLSLTHYIFLFYVFDLFFFLSL